VNFFNPKDYALTDVSTWPLNEATKPDGGYDFGADGPGGATTFIRTRIPAGVNPDLNLAVLSDRWEVFAFAASPHAPALGAVSGVAGPFNKAKEVDLSGASFGFTDHQWDHSAEFNGDYATRAPYWNALQKAFGIQTWS
jgi:hypothetical protein